MSVLAALPLLFLLVTVCTFAESVVEDQGLGFGEIAVLGNSQVSTVTIYNDGRNSVATGDVVIIRPGQPGIYQLVDYPSNQTLSVSINCGLMTGGGEPFTVSGITYDSAIIADSNGDAVLEVGATLNTSGDGGTYFDANYSAILNVIVSY